MKKIKHVINGKQRTILLEDDIAKDLFATQNQELIANYLELRWKEQCRDRAETRRHQSLELSIEGGYQFVDKSTSIELEIIQEENIRELLECLDTEQKKLVIKCYIYGFSQKELAEELGITKAAMSQRMRVIKEKIKKNYSQP